MIGQQKHKGCIWAVNFNIWKSRLNFVAYRHKENANGELHNVMFPISLKPKKHLTIYFWTSQIYVLTFQTVNITQIIVLNAPITMLDKGIMTSLSPDQNPSDFSVCICGPVISQSLFKASPKPKRWENTSY